jgi:ribonuclease-3
MAGTPIHDAGGVTSERPVTELAQYLLEVTGGPVDAALLVRSLTHRSHAYEAGGTPHNERLEFLGDSVLGVVVTDTLYTDHPELSEGHLAKLRAAVVNMRALAGVARAMGLGDYLLLGKGEESTGGRDKDSILADTTEAVIGAVYLSGGMQAAEALVHHLLDPLMVEAASIGAGLDWKTSLQEAASGLALGTPVYRLTDEGPEHEKIFHADVLLAGEVHGNGTGRTKKDAEQQAAERAWRALRQLATSRDTGANADGTGQVVNGMDTEPGTDESTRSA